MRPRDTLRRPRSRLSPRRKVKWLTSPLLFRSAPAVVTRPREPSSRFGSERARANRSFRGRPLDFCFAARDHVGGGGKTCQSPLELSQILAGSDPGAPMAPMLIKKGLITTGVSIVVFAAFLLLVKAMG